MAWKEHLVGYSVALTTISLVALLMGVVAMRYAVIYMPADYLVRDGHDDGWWFDQHPVVRWTLLILKNFVGMVFLFIGGVMLLVPGPGVMLLLLGLWLVNLPGKRRMERWLVSFPAVHKQIDKLRAKHGQSPLKFPR